MKQRFAGYATRFALMSLLPLALFACGGGEEDSLAQTDAGGNTRTISVHIEKAQTRLVSVELHSVGRLVSRNAPALAAEIDARVVAVLVEEGEAVRAGQELVLLDETMTELARRVAVADIERLKISIANEQRRVGRYRDLETRDLMPQERLDDAQAQLDASQASLQAAEARLAVAQDRLERSRLVAPFDGVVERRLVSVGDFATVGKPLVTITDTRSLRALLPFPETVGSQLHKGQQLFITSVIAPGREVEAEIDEIRPQLGVANKALMVIADVINPGFWRPEATINARLVVEKRPDAVVVPMISVVIRPAGDVVYLFDAGHVRQQVVEKGEILDGWVEIRKGLSAGDRVVSEGAYYLTDGASVSVREPGN